jgi:hypothetical protein
MGTRGRKSAADLAVVHGILQRPAAPDELTSEQATEWQAVVSRMPVDWFPREIWPLLCAYCRHVTNSRHIAGLIEDAHKGDLSDRKALMQFNRLLGMQERQSSTLAGLATRMRLTQQSRYTPHSAASRTKGSTSAKKLWET